jgi:hypothetical protein
MNSRIVRVTAATLTAVSLVLLLVGLLSSIAAGHSSPVNATTDNNNEADPSLIAIRAISVPFSIDSTLPLMEGGSKVDVIGHGQCPEGGEHFRLRVHVTQDAPGVRAVGQTEEICDPEGERQIWTTVASLPGPWTFEPGPAEACAMVVIHQSSGGAMTNQWCVAVNLVEE